MFLYLKNPSAFPLLRGHRTYLNLFDEPDHPVLQKAERRGRSEQFHTRRNELLIHRYYYLVKIQGRQYQATLEQLEQELFIAQATIINNVSEERTLLKALNAQKPDVSFFKKKYPWIVW